eukprot:CAMPEP_0183304662 /NCGR_PEP_ID=MMETSP0160_2-20130417/9672_1 /TAXON_ID=2839 ORGANISM="Odontella Sinensis, Strain Grunow 1884" /NCGR_SAMPLE_ID=MMETSP0160_2 /ASSEMBLY_ACC=CAM_ASM_000250 /LENGTH=518 /DNA_ID=CAMNT_0025467753 /DNA_START=60 /DNA_END=1613 /DNA_ORIENTATION=+
MGSLRVPFGGFSGAPVLLLIGVSISASAFFHPVGLSQRHGKISGKQSVLFYTNDPQTPMNLPAGTYWQHKTSSVTSRNAPPDLGTSKHDIAWGRIYADLQMFYDAHGHTDVPYNYPPNKKLSVWVTYQRRARKRGKLSLTRIEALNLLRFTWETRVPWRQRYSELVEYKNNHGHCNVAYNSDENPTLGRWLANQRQQYRMLCEGQESTMTEKRVSALISIGALGQEGIREEIWEKKLHDLKQFRAMNNAWPSRSQGELGRWVDTQRTAFRLLKKGKPSPMTAARIQKLEQIGFDWDPMRAAWEEQLEQMQQYKDKNCDMQLIGKLDNRQVEKKCDTDGIVSKKMSDKMVQEWMETQRTQLRFYQASEVLAMKDSGSELPADCERKNRRGKIPWSVRYNQLKAYRRKNGNCRVPQSTKLGQWVKAQKRQYKLMKIGKSSSMTMDRVDKLIELEMFPGDVIKSTTGKNGIGRLGRQKKEETQNCELSCQEEKVQLQGDIVSHLAPFITTAMSDDEKLAAW